MGDGWGGGSTGGGGDGDVEEVGGGGAVIVAGAGRRESEGPATSKTRLAVLAIRCRKLSGLDGCGSFMDGGSDHRQ